MALLVFSVDIRSMYVWYIGLKRVNTAQATLLLRHPPTLFRANFSDDFLQSMGTHADIQNKRKRAALEIWRRSTSFHVGVCPSRRLLHSAPVAEKKQPLKIVIGYSRGCAISSPPV